MYGDEWDAVKSWEFEQSASKKRLKYNSLELPKAVNVVTSRSNIIANFMYIGKSIFSLTLLAVL